jgi:signal transduction histidine kinase/CheY-like chemotaxis protein
MLFRAVRYAIGRAGQEAKRRQADEALRASKDLLENVLNTLPVGVWIMDANGKIIKGNPAGLQVWAGAKYVGPEQFGDYKGWWVSSGKLITPEAWAAARAIRGGETSFNEEIEIECFDGMHKIILNSAVPLRNDRGEITGGIIINNDISDRKRAEQALAEKTDQLRQSQKIEAVGRLAGGVAHDFNNLLTVITGYCELMMIKIGEGNPLLPDLQEIGKSADRAAALTRQLLAFSRRQILQPKVLEIDTVIPEMYKMLHRLIGEDINLTTNLSAGAGKVKFDPSQIEQVIVNLVINSRDAMPDGGAITIETANVELDEAYVRLHGGAWPGPHVMLAVSDTGCGMDPETLSKAFDPFFTTKEKGKGTGLGLSTVFGIVKQSGGCLYAYSEPGRGTTMKIYLPRVSGETAPKDEKRDAGFDDRLNGSEAILLVEDDETLRKLASSVLEGYGYTVLSAGNGEEALQRLNDSPGIPRLLVTDVVMPKMGGRELSDQLKAIHPGIRVLFMSGYTDNSIVHYGVLDPGVSYLPKPFTPKALARKVREVLDRK